MTDRPAPGGTVVGAVLTGGASRRMGVDKATLVVEGVPMAVRVADALRAAGAVAVVVVGHAVDGEDHVADAHPGEGPLGGVLTALAHAATTGAGRLVVAPCDLVAPDPAAFAALVATLDRHPAAAAVIAGPDDPLPLALRLAPTAAVTAGLADVFAAGERSLRRAVAGLDPIVAHLPAGATADADVPADLPPGAR